MIELRDFNNAEAIQMASALTEALAIFKSNGSTEEAFKLSLQKYVELAPKNPTRSGQYLMEQFLRGQGPEGNKAWLPYVYTLMTELTEAKEAQIKLFIKKSQPGFNPYTIKTKDGTVITEGAGFNHKIFEALADFHNL